jgi:hypothetical protein
MESPQEGSHPWRVGGYDRLPLVCNLKGLPYPRNSSYRLPQGPKLVYQG